MRPVITATTWGFCCLLHFAAPLGNLTNVRAPAQHYIGFAADDGRGRAWSTASPSTWPATGRASHGRRWRAGSRSSWWPRGMLH